MKKALNPVAWESLSTRQAARSASVSMAIVLISGGALAQIGNALAQVPCVPVVDHVAFAQVIQTDPPTIPALDLKATTMRVFVKPGPGCTGATTRAGGVTVPLEAPLQNVDARFSLWNLGTPDVNADNGPIHVVHSPPYSKEKRQLPEDLNHPSLNFTFIPTQAYDLGASAQGYTEIGVCLVLSGADACLSQSNVVVQKNFVHLRNPRVLGVTIELAEELTEPRPELEDVMDLDRKAHQIWPFNEWTWYGVIRPPDSSEISRISFDPSTNASELLSLLERFRLLFSSSMAPVDCVYGWIGGSAVGGGYSPPSGDPRCVGFGDIESALTGETSGAGVFAHEVGHFVVQLNHESDGSRINDVGWSPIYLPLHPNRIRESDTFSIMINGGGFVNDWSSIDSYAAALTASQFLSGNIVTSQFLVVSGVVSEEMQSATMAPIIQVTGTQSITSVLGGSIVLTAHSATETELFSTTVVSEPSGPTWFSVPIPVESASEIAYVRVGSITSTLASITRTAAAPTATLLRPTAHESVSDTLTVEWAGDDSDGNDVFATVQYSHNGGETWMPLVYQSSETSVSVSTQLLPASTSGALRLYLTDGLNTSVATVSGLELGENQGPFVTIASPVSGSVFRTGSNVALVASAFDLEDGAIFEVTGTVASPIQWSSSLDGSLGSGSVINLDTLSPGAHTITLRVEDMAGAEATDIVTITVD